MFIPLYDGKPVEHISLHWATLGLIALNVAVFLFSLLFPPLPGQLGALTLGFGYVPSVANDLRVLPEEFTYLPEHLYFLTAISYSFLHADWWHLAGNMLFLWVFGDNVEDAMGHLKFIAFYLLAAIAAAYFHALMFPESDSPLIGASGAAAAVVAAYLMLHPKVRVWGLVLGRIPVGLPAIWLLGAWIGFQIFMFLTDTDSEVSWAAHIGGIVAGVVLLPLMKRRDVPLFDRDISAPVHSKNEPVSEAPKRSKPWERGGSN